VALRLNGLIVGKARVARLISELNIYGMCGGKTIFTTKADKTNSRAPDLVICQFIATLPNVLGLSDLTCVSKWSGFIRIDEFTPP